MNDKQKRAHERPTRPVMERIGDFFEGKGFYIVLFLCIAAIGISGYVIFSGTGDAEREPSLYEDRNPEESESVVEREFPLTESVSEQTDENVDVSGSAGTSNATDAAAASGSSTSAADDGAAANATVTGLSDGEPAKTVSAAAADTFFMRPVPGAIAANFSGKALAYSVTMDDWRVHQGIDIAAATGEPVKAIADGVVKSVETDPYSGVTVTIEHDGGYTAVYGNLQKEVFVVKNQTVKVGDTIGGVGSTMLTEAKADPHLHLEVWKDGAAIDPQDVLPKAAN